MRAAADARASATTSPRSSSAPTLPDRDPDRDRDRDCDRNRPPPVFVPDQELTKGLSGTDVTLYARACAGSDTQFSKSVWHFAEPD